MRLALTTALLAGLCAFGVARRAGASHLPPRLPPSCDTRVEVRGSSGYEQLGCAVDAGRLLREAGRPAGCPAVGPLRDGARVTLLEAGACGVRVGRMAGPALRLLRLPIDINLSSVEDLQALPGIGPALALRIAAGRPYRTISELREVAGIGPKRLSALIGATEIETSRLEPERSSGQRARTRRP